MGLYQKYLFSGILIFLVMVLGLWFVMALNPGTPTDLYFGQNVTSIYDEGNFTLNWTAAVGSNATHYNVTIFFNSTSVALWQVTGNDSETGYFFNNWTEGNYTFYVGGWNSTDGTGTNSTNISMYVDRTAPVITLPVYTNGTAKKNTAQLTLNISVIDASSGETGSHCLIDVNGTSNQTVLINTRWCNTTVLNLTGSSDGNSTLKVYVNDTVNIFGLNNSFVVQVDTTAPTASASCSPKTVTTGSSFPCTCSGSDATSGVSSSSGSSTSNSITKTSNTGQFTYTCTVTDNAGNSASSTAKYIVEQTPGSPRTTTTWTTHTITQGVFEQGYTRELGVRNRIKVQIEAEDHFIGVVSVSESQATIEISSDPVQVTLAAGEEAKVDVTDDGFYDVYVLLNGITNNKADITIQKIYEEVPEGGTGVETNGEIEGEPSAEEEGGISVWIWIVIAVVIVAIVFWQMKAKKK